MCGICGSTRPGAERAVAAMNARMTHRGPDDEGMHVDAVTGVAIGARRLSIIDVAGGHQPLGTPDGSVWAVLNGEIYNHPELREQLQRDGHRLATRTDTEVLVHLYEERGDDLLDALDGMYALAIWDAGRERLLLARDRFGEKPLFYSDAGGDLIFASELSALRAGDDRAWTIDPSAVDAVFRQGWVDHPASMVREARQLSPAHLLSWRRGHGAELRRYWEAPAPASGSAAIPRMELAGEAHRLLRRSVRSRMISDVPVGVFLSGGVDSSLVTALASEVSPGNVRTFTVGYDTGHVDERAAARRVASALGADHTEVVLGSVETADRVPAVLRSMDQPIADQALIAAHCVAELARRRVTVAVGGEGADELFGGYPRYAWLVRGQRLSELLPPPVATLAGALLRAAPLPGRLRRLPSGVDRLSPLERQRAWVEGDRTEWRTQLYGPRLLAELGIRQDPPPGAWAGPDVGAELMSSDRAHWLPDDVLTKADRASMMVSLEVRTPFLSREVAEFATAIPSAIHLRNGGKSLLREVLARMLPEPERARGKTGFLVPAADWLRGPLLETVRELLVCSRLFRDGWFDRGAVSRLAGEHAAGDRDHTALLWPVLSLAFWLDAGDAS